MSPVSWVVNTGLSEAADMNWILKDSRASHGQAGRRRALQIRAEVQQKKGADVQRTMRAILLESESSKAVVIQVLRLGLRQSRRWCVFIIYQFPIPVLEDAKKIGDDQVDKTVTSQQFERNKTIKSKNPEQKSLHIWINAPNSSNWNPQSTYDLTMLCSGHSSQLLKQETSSSILPSSTSSLWSIQQPISHHLPTGLPDLFLNCCTLLILPTPIPIDSSHKKLECHLKILNLSR